MTVINMYNMYTIFHTRSQKYRITNFIKKFWRNLKQNGAPLYEDLLPLFCITKISYTIPGDQRISHWKERCDVYYFLKS